MTITTRTLNPLPFESLEPHRFEDLVRNLLYDFREWQVIEPTGKGGGDDGFDIRAWEKTSIITNKNEGDENNEGVHTTEGNLWMIQCKREKEVGPSKIKKIISDNIDKKNPPYGYILSASTNISKKSYDVFREELSKKGVMEFYFWGKLQLEDMLFMPKNDRVLFAFFGISLVTRRRTKTSEIKFIINNKNKLFKIFETAKTQNFYKDILLRDFNDKQYPYEGEYKDFKKLPRWRDYVAYGYHPLGLKIHAKEYYAYVDVEKKEFDFTSDIDLVRRQRYNRYFDEEKAKLRTKIFDYWEHLAKKNQAFFLIDGVVLFENMLIIDDKGDSIYDFPHIYVEYVNKKYRFFDGIFNFIKKDNKEINILAENYKRIKIFPRKFLNPVRGKIYKDKIIELIPEVFLQFKAGVYFNELFDIDGKYKFLNIRDIILVKEKNETIHSDDIYLTVTHKYIATVAGYLKETGKLKTNIETQLGKAVKDDEKMTVFEVKRHFLYE